MRMCLAATDDRTITVKLRSHFYVTSEKECWRRARRRVDRPSALKIIGDDGDGSPIVRNRVRKRRSRQWGPRTAPKQSSMTYGCNAEAFDIGILR